MDVFGPLFSYRQDWRETHLAFRPFFYWQKEEKHSRAEYLYPLGKYERTEREVKSYLMPFYSTHRDLTQGEKRERGFLLAFWGETDKGEPYGGFFPFYGHLKNRFKRDEINFFLWPIYSDSREGESRAYSLLWPIFTFYEGGGREGARVWPLAGQVKKENDYEKTFFLWPIFHFEKRYLYTDDPTEINMVFPLYVSMASSRRVQRSLLWPFFTYAHDEEDHYTQWDFPWPILQWAEGDQKEIRRFFPVYGRKYWEGRERGYFLWPIYWYARQEDDQYKKSTERFLLLSKDETEIWKKGQEERRIRVWPLFYYRQEKLGGVYFYWPCLIPLDFEGFERNWVPLFTLYEYRRTPQGDQESKFLWGIYVHRQNSVRDLYELSFFFTYYSAEDLIYFSLLKGLLEYRSRGSKKALRLLYSPWPMEWESPASSSRAVGRGPEEGRKETEEEE